MTTSMVARKDFEDAVRSKMVWSLIAVFVALTTFLLVVFRATVDSGDVPADAALSFLAQFGQLFVPLIALVAAYMAVVGERRSGSLRVLLAYPHSRRDVVAGKLLGRGGVVLLAFVVGFTVATVVASAMFEAPALGEFLTVLVAVVLFGLAFCGLAVGISAAAATRGKAMALAIGSFLLFLMFWDGIAAGVYYAVHGSLPGLQADAWYFLLKRLSPIEAFRLLAQSALDGVVNPMIALPVEDLPEGTLPWQVPIEERVEGDLPLYLEDWFNAVVLAAWAVVPPVVGYLRFERSDL